jgi:hypothetical protein
LFWRRGWIGSGNKKIRNKHEASIELNPPG